MTRAPIPLSVPRIRGNAWKYVKNCLDTEWVSSAGPYVARFEAEVARCTGSPTAAAGVNGTACLHVAVKIAGVKPGEGVIVPALTFIATANAVSYCRAACLFVDCEPRRFNLDLDALEDFLANRCRRRGGRLVTAAGIPVKAVLATHILGYPMDMTRMTSLARRYGLTVIEDAAESMGSTWRGRHTGTWGSVGVLSFNGNKILTAGGGGMILASRARLGRSARHLMQQAKAAPEEYIHDEIGYNYRMTNMAAALGLSQLELLPRFLRERARAARWYREALPGAPVEPVEKDAFWNRWLFSVEAADAAQKIKLLKDLGRAGIQARPLWRPVPLQSPYRNSVCPPIPNARRAYDTVVNIPSSSSLTARDVARVAARLKRFPIRRLLV